MTVRRIIFVFLCGIFLFCSTSYATDTPLPTSDQANANAVSLTTKKRILIIYSAAAQSEKILREALFSRIEREQISDKDRPEIFEEFMNGRRTKLNSTDFDPVFTQYLQQKYANVKLDLVVGHVPEAINFLANHPELFPNVSRYALTSNQPINSSNAFFNTNKENVFNTILQVLPKTERIIVIKTKMKIEKVDWADISNLNLRKKINVEIWNDFSFEELYENVKQLPEHTVVLFLHAKYDNKGRLPEEDVMTKLTKIASVPVFIHGDVNLHKPGAMAVGGYVFSNKQLGDFFGRNLLNEEIPETSEALQAQLYGYYFNDHALKRWKIPDENLPEGSIILGREESIFYTYRWYLAATLLVILSELTLIAWLTRSLRHRKIMALELADERDHLEERVEQRTYDLAERTEQLEEAQVLFQDAANVAKLGVFNYDLMTKKLSWDAPMFAIYGIASFECSFSGCNSLECHSKNCHSSLRDEWKKVTHPEDIKKVEVALQTAIKENSEFNISFRIQRSDGKTQKIHALGQVYRDENGKPLRVVGINQDITEREEAEEIIRNLAYFDPLTQLPNRRMLAERLQQAISNCHRKKKKFAVMMMDLDKFKAVNDTFGHAAGDELLIQVAARIKVRLRENDTVARLGGDEFVILLADVHSPDDTKRVANALIETLTQTFKLSQSDNVQIGTSIGIAFYPQHGEEGDVLMDKADTARYTKQKIMDAVVLLIIQIKSFSIL